MASQYLTAYEIILMYVKTSFRSATDIMSSSNSVMHLPHLHLDVSSSVDSTSVDGCISSGDTRTLVLFSTASKLSVSDVSEIA